MKPKRFFGELTVTLPDGYVEKCQIKERGEHRFLEEVKNSLLIILKSSEEKDGNVNVTYRGDFSGVIYQLIKKTTDKERER